MVYHLIYFSKATRAMDARDLEDLLAESVAWNKNHSLTGILAYIEGSLDGHSEGRFMQLLEGPRDEVVWIFNRIKKDRRHYGVTILNERDKQQLDFLGWSMKFEKLDLNAYPHLKIFFEMDNSIIESSWLNNNDSALNFLKAF